MVLKTYKTTRREFLKTSGKIAGAVFFSGVSLNCLNPARNSKKTREAAYCVQDA
jgi:hypothetical protein